MNLLPGVKRINSAGTDLQQVAGAGKPMRIYSVHLVSGATSSVMKLHNMSGGATSATTAYAQIDGAASQGITVGFNGGLRFPAGCYVSVDSALSYATIIYTEEF